MTMKFKNINKSYGDKVIFKDFEISFQENKVNCIVGKSGCGKSTLLKLISGLLKNDSKDFKSLKNRDISYIFQEDRLIEWLTIEENIEIVGKRSFEKLDLKDRAKKYIKLVGIEEYKDQYPQMVSGGIRQRANIARAFINNSTYILMDEPFKSIDIKNKHEIMKQIKDILKNENKTVIFVTHDIEEAMLLSDCIFVLGNQPVDIKRAFYDIAVIDKEDIIKII